MNGIAFASPWVLAAAVAVAVPVLAHLARHEDRQGRGFPSLMFLHRIPFPARARHRLKDRALLALRALAVLALVLAFAGPHPQADPSASDAGARDTVVLLDVSYSMGAGDGFAAARALAAATLDEAGAGERTALVLFDEQARVASPLDAAPGAARAALAGAAPGHRGTDFGAALRRAAQLLAHSRAPVRRVVLVSDLQQAGLATGAALTRGIELELRPTPIPAAGNLSLIEAAAEPSGGDGRERLRVVVRNTSPQPVASRLHVRVNGLDAATEALSLEPGAVHELLQPVFPADGAVTRVAVSLDADALASDNERFLVLEPPRPLKALLLTGGGSAPYVAAALAPARRPAIALERLTADALTPRSFDGVDLLVLDGPLPDDAPVREALRDRAAGGMRVLAFASAAAGLPDGVPRLDAPQRLDAPASLVPTALAHPLAPVLGDGVAAVGPVWRAGAVDAPPGHAVLATFDDGSPAVVAAERDGVRSLVVATAPGDGWSALGRRPEFAPWLVRSARWLAGVVPATPGYRPGSVVDVATLAAGTAVGAAFAGAVASGERVSVRRPSGGIEPLAGDRPLVVEEPGFHELRAGPAGPLWVAVSVAAPESDLSRLTAQQFAAQIERPAGGPDPGTADAPPPPDPAWAWMLAVLGALLLALEGLVAGWMARRQAQAQEAAA